MHLEHCQVTYTVDLCSYPLVDPNTGEQAYALFDPANRRIPLSMHTPPGERLDTLLHEWHHVVAWHTPPPEESDSEDAAQWYASSTGSFIRQLMRQGGPAALLALEAGPSGAFDPDAFQRSLVTLDADRVMMCAVCQQRIAPGSVAVTGTRADTKTAAPIVELAFVCPHCEHVQHWGEFANAGGKPSGVCALEPEYLGGDELAAFEAAWPHKLLAHAAV
ncbi:MAG: hypothetical protein AAFY08_14095 [Planctomycetota bacterium]